jgi:hypothetical protein
LNALWEVSVYQRGIIWLAYLAWQMPLRIAWLI